MRLPREWVWIEKKRSPRTEPVGSPTLREKGEEERRGERRRWDGRDGG